MTRRKAESLRIGCVKYLNAQPLIHGWDGEVLFDHPSALCNKLASGELDAAFVSSFEFLRNPIYSIVDDVAVAAEGPVYSVFVAHRGPIESLEEIAVDPASNTSVNLLRCIVAGRELQAQLVASADQTITDSRGRLLIGDQAIRFRQEHGQEVKYWDLAAAWRESTGLPFVFALWLIRPEVFDAKEIADRLRVQRDENLSALDELIAAQTQFSPEFCRFYFRDCLRFSFAEREKRGLLMFRELCEKQGLIAPSATALRLV